MTAVTRACRFCAAALEHLVVDLGTSPLANRYLEPDEASRMEPFYPLRVWVCDRCWLCQLEEFESPSAIFGHYAYFSSYADSWLGHARAYTEMITARLGLGPKSRVIEIASNDGYLLQYFVERGIPVLGIEPAGNVAEAAIARGIPTLVEFFGAACARRVVTERGPADLIVGNNVLAHVPDLNDFVEGLARLLAPGGTATLEFPHLLRLMAENQFDTIYHEHFSYFSFTTVERVFAAHGLSLVDVDELPTHGGSLRIYARHAGAERSERVLDLLRREVDAGLTTLAPYRAFTESVYETKRALLDFLIAARRERKVVAGYGAPAKGNTLLNYCGIRTDLLDFTVDRSPHKQGRLLPGTHIPIHHPDRIRESRPDFVLILPWNLRDEVMRSVGYIRDWGGQFVVPIPEVKILP